MKATYQDYQKATDKVKFITDCIDDYKASTFYSNAVDGQNYFDGNNTYILKEMKPLRMRMKGQDIELPLNKITSDIFKRLILQVCNYQLAKGIILNGESINNVFGENTDRNIMRGAIRGMVHGVCYGFVPNNKLEKMFTALEMFTLNDEWTDEPKIAIRFWSVNTKSGTVKFFQVYDNEGFTNYRVDSDNVPQPFVPNGNELIAKEVENYKIPYSWQVTTDNATGSRISKIDKKDKLPIVRLWVNDTRKSELSFNIKSKIDTLDEVVSRNATFVNRTAMIFWLINNTQGGSSEDITQMVMELEKLGIAVNDEDMSATPQTVDPNVAPRLETKQSLEDDIYKDFMALNMEQLTKGQLTATAINASSAMLRMRATDLYYYICDFIHKLCEMIGYEVKSIEMTPQVLTNTTETVQAIQNSSADLDLKTRLILNPLVDNNMVDEIMKQRDAETLAGE